MVDNAQTHVAGAILFVCAVSFDGAIISAEKYKCFPCFIINSPSLSASLFHIIAKCSLAILKYRFINAIPKVKFVMAYADIARRCHF